MKLTTTVLLLISLSMSDIAIAHVNKAHTDTSNDKAIEIIPINEHIFMLRGEGGNIGVFDGDNHTILIDSQFERTAEKVQEAIKSVSNKPLAYLINTHYHSDHTGGNPSFSEKGATVIAHEKTREILAATRDASAPNPRLPDYSDALLPYLTFSENLWLHESKESIEIIHFPNAHTESDIAVFFTTSNVIHAGDLYFVGVTPFIDVKNGGTYDGYVAAMEAILKRADENTIIIPGHGPLATKEMMQRDYEEVASFDHTDID
ncbi:MAG: MBL fold metallo-hydrolase [Pseudomonadota bacterium]